MSIKKKSKKRTRKRGFYFVHRSFSSHWNFNKKKWTQKKKPIKTIKRHKSKKNKKFGGNDDSDNDDEKKEDAKKLFTEITTKFQNIKKYESDCFEYIKKNIIDNYSKIIYKTCLNNNEFQYDEDLENHVFFEKNYINLVFFKKIFEHIFQENNKFQLFFKINDLFILYENFSKNYNLEQIFQEEEEQQQKNIWKNIEKFKEKRIIDQNEQIIIFIELFSNLKILNYEKILIDDNILDENDENDEEDLKYFSNIKNDIIYFLLPNLNFELWSIKITNDERSDGHNTFESIFEEVFKKYIKESLKQNIKQNIKQQISNKKLSESQQKEEFNKIYEEIKETKKKIENEVIIHDERQRLQRLSEERIQQTLEEERSIRLIREEEMKMENEQDEIFKNSIATYINQHNPEFYNFNNIQFEYNKKIFNDMLNMKGFNFIDGGDISVKDWIQIHPNNIVIGYIANTPNDNDELPDNYINTPILTERSILRRIFNNETNDPLTTMENHVYECDVSLIPRINRITGEPMRHPETHEIILKRKFNGVNVNQGTYVKLGKILPFYYAYMKSSDFEELFAPEKFIHQLFIFKETPKKFESVISVNLQTQLGIDNVSSCQDGQGGSVWKLFIGERYFLPPPVLPPLPPVLPPLPPSSSSKRKRET